MYRNPHHLVIQYKLLRDLSAQDHKVYTPSDFWFHDDYLNFLNYIFHLEDQGLITVVSITLDEQQINSIKVADSELKTRYHEEVFARPIRGGYDLDTKKYQSLSEDIYTATNLSRSQVQELVQWESKYIKKEAIFLWSILHINIELTTEQKNKLEENFADYLTSFQDDDFYQPKKSFLSYKLQKDQFFINLANTKVQLGRTKGITVEPTTAFAPLEGKFWEVVFILEREGVYKIVEYFFRGSNSYVVVNMCRPLYHAEVVKSFFVIQKEDIRQEIEQMQYAPQLKLTIDKWLHSKQVIDTFSHFITTVPDRSASIPFVVSHEKVFEYSQAQHLYELGIFGYYDTMSFTNYQTEYVVLNERGFKLYHTEISNLYYWLNTEYQKRIHPTPDESSKMVKKLHVDARKGLYVDGVEGLYSARPTSDNWKIIQLFKDKTRITTKDIILLITPKKKGAYTADDVSKKISEINDRFDSHFHSNLLTSYDNGGWSINSEFSTCWEEHG